jgi:hypothetical protein
MGMVSDHIRKVVLRPLESDVAQGQKDRHQDQAWKHIGEHRSLSPKQRTLEGVDNAGKRVEQIELIK